MPLDLDDRVIEDARFGGPALDVLITAVWPEAYRIALTVLRDPGLAEDAAQEACASIARSLPNLKNSSGFRGWSYKTIVRCAITLARRRPRTEAIDDAINRAIDSNHTDALDLHNALASLPPVQRGAVVLHYYAGLSSSEIAAATGLHASTIRFHLMLARRRLRTALSTESSAIRSRDEVPCDVK